MHGEIKAFYFVNMLFLNLTIRWSTFGERLTVNDVPIRRTTIVARVTTEYFIIGVTEHVVSCNNFTLLLLHIYVGHATRAK